MRNWGIDALKVMCCLSVVWIHFGYAGVFTALAAIGVSVAMISCPALFALSSRITNPLRRLAGMTAGIYYIHVIVGFVVSRFVDNQCVLFLLTLIGSLLLVNWISLAPGMSVALSAKGLNKKG